MKYALSGEGYENTIVLEKAFSYLNSETSGRNLKLRYVKPDEMTISMFMIEKLLPSYRDYDLVMSLTENTLSECLKDIKTGKGLHKASYILQRLSFVTESLTNGRYIYSELIRNVINNITLTNYETCIIGPASIYLYAINRLRKYTNIFLGVFAVRNTPNENSNNSRIEKGTLLTENLDGYVQLLSVLTSLSIDQYKNILSKIMQGLELAHRLYAFKHNNLTPIEVYVRRNVINFSEEDIKINFSFMCTIGDYYAFSDAIKTDYVGSDIHFFVKACIRLIDSRIIGSLHYPSNNPSLVFDLKELYQSLFKQKYEDEDLYSVIPRQNFNKLFKALDLYNIKELRPTIKVLKPYTINDYIFKNTKEETSPDLFLLRERYLESLNVNCPSYLRHEHSNRSLTEKFTGSLLLRLNTYQIESRQLIIKDPIERVTLRDILFFYLKHKDSNKNLNNRIFENL